MITLNPVTVRNLFADLNDQWEVLIALYKLVFPNWEEIIKLTGYPTINDHTWSEIATFFVAFDRIHHPDVIPGGNWMNRGFTVDDTLPSWIVSLDNCDAVYG